MYDMVAISFRPLHYFRGNESLPVYKLPFDLNSPVGRNRPALNKTNHFMRFRRIFCFHLNLAFRGQITGFIREEPRYVSNPVT